MNEKVSNIKRYFITNRTEHHIPTGWELNNSLAPFLEGLKLSPEIALDTEYNNLDTILADLLLVSLATPNLTLVIDATSVDLKPLKELEDTLIIGQNVKVDFQMLYQQGIDFKNLYDTMIMEQRFALGVRQSNSLVAIHKRRLGFDMPEDKNTRVDFVKAKTTITFKEEHIRYSGYDAECLLPIKKAQKEFIEKANHNYLLYNIEFPFIRCLALSELEGTIVDKNQVKENIEYTKNKLFEIEKAMDEELIELAYDFCPELKDSFKLKERKKLVSTEQTNLFGDSSIITPKRKNAINYSSPAVISKIFDIVEGVRPVSTKTNKESTGEDALLEFLIEYPDTVLKKFINLLLDYREYAKILSTYGEQFLSDTYIKNGKRVRGYINPVTGKAHTIYRQCITETARLASGEKGQANKKSSKKKVEGVEIVQLDNEYPRYNSQNIPRKEEFRKIIVAPEGQYITTADYSGMELVIAASNSQDKKLIEIHDKDIHSYLATKCYTGVIHDILQFEKKRSSVNNNFLFESIKQILWTTAQKCPNEIVEIAIEEVSKGNEFVISNYEGDVKHLKHLKHLRTDFKSLVYGILYGSSVKRIQQVLNISHSNALIVDRVMRQELPDLFNYLDRVSQFGTKFGFIKFNEITHSRHIFNSWVEARRYNAELSFKELTTIERACKNYPIQGTSADITKEAAVNLRKYIDRNKVNANILLYVHDELVVRHEDKDFGYIIQDIMVNTANKYLKNVTMKAEYKTLTHWTK